MKTSPISITLVFLLYARLVTAQGNLVLNGGFDTNAAGWSTNGPVGYPIGAYWTATGGNPGGCLEVLWSTGQTISGLISGNNYLLSWSGFSFGDPNKLGVTLNNALMYTVDGSVNHNWEYFGFVFTATSSSVDLGFANSFNAFTYNIDNVSMESIPENPVPVLRMFPTQNWVALSVSGPLGRSVILESSTNLVSWQPFATNALPCFCSHIPKNPISTFYRGSMPSQ